MLEYRISARFHFSTIKCSVNVASSRGIYSDQFAELGKGGKNQPLKKRGKKSARGTTFRREKEGEKQGKEGSSGKKQGSTGKKRETEKKRFESN